MERSNGAVKTAFDLQVNGKRGPGRPKMTWKQLTERDRREWKLSAIEPHDRDTWRSGVRSGMRAASQLPEGGPLLWIWPLYLHVNKKSDDDDDDDGFPQKTFHCKFNYVGTFSIFCGMFNNVIG